jgi:putative SOS response-associated peptidase YedK
MCGRYTLTTDLALVQQVLSFHFPTDPPPPRYNIAPGQAVLAVRPEPDGSRTGTWLRWGYVPPWASAPNPVINARLETLATKPFFRAAARTGRVVLPADGYYEWAPGPGRKQPYRVVAADDTPFFLAGVATSETPPTGPTLPTCAIVTRPAWEPLAWLHPRMPLVLTAEQAQTWLHTPFAVWRAVFAVPPDPPRLRAYPVSPRINRPTVDDPACIMPVAAG